MYNIVNNGDKIDIVNDITSNVLTKNLLGVNQLSMVQSQLKRTHKVFC